MNRRNFIKSAILGIGAITVPLVVRAEPRPLPFYVWPELTDNDCWWLPNDLYDADGVAHKELSEASLEEACVNIAQMAQDRGAVMSIKPTKLLAFPNA